jgi:hypothetical protein
LTLPGVFGNQVLGVGNLLLCGDQCGTQAFKFRTQFTFRLTRVRRRDECPGFEMSVTAKDL